MGREIVRLVDVNKSAGYYQVVWDGRNSHGKELTSGIYIYRMTGEDSKGKEQFMMTKKFLLLK